MGMRTMAFVVGISRFTAARGQLIPTLQDRFVGATASAENFGGPSTVSNQSFQAPDFGPFVRAAGASAAGNVGARGEASASQNSTISSTTIAATGAVSASGRSGSLGGILGQGEGFFRMIVTFEVAEPIQVHLRSDLDTTVFSQDGSDASISLSRIESGNPVVVVSRQVDHAGTQTAHLDVFRLLVPATYILSLQGHARMFVPSSSTLITSGVSVSASMTVVPEPGVLIAASLAAATLGRRRRRLPIRQPASL